MTTWDKDWMMCFTGRQVFPLAVKPEDVDIRDIAHHTAQICRYNGATNGHYSVAEHCVLIASALFDVGGTKLALQGLLHDAAEAYTGDFTRPVKNSLKRVWEDWKSVEDNNEAAIAKRFGVELPFDPRVKEYDKRIIVNEKEALFGVNKPWGWDYEPLPDTTIHRWERQEAERMYLLTFAMLTGDWNAFIELENRRGLYAEHR